MRASIFAVALLAGTLTSGAAAAQSAARRGRRSIKAGLWETT